MQLTIYYRPEDAYLIDKVDRKARHERKSRSAVILSLLEKGFESGKRLGEILIDMGAISPADLSRALQLKQETHAGKRIGDILLEEELATREVVARALLIQSNRDRANMLELEDVPGIPGARSGTRRSRTPSGHTDPEQ